MLAELAPKICPDPGPFPHRARQRPAAAPDLAHLGFRSALVCPMLSCGLRNTGGRRSLGLSVEAPIFSPWSSGRFCWLLAALPLLGAHGRGEWVAGSGLWALEGVG